MRISATEVSRDLDFFFHRGSVDLDRLARRLSAAVPVRDHGALTGTLNGLFSATKVQFLHADEGQTQHLLEAPRTSTGCMSPDQRSVRDEAQGRR